MSPEKSNRGWEKTKHEFESMLRVEEKAEFFERILQTQANFSERIIINNDGSLVTQKVTELAGEEGSRATITGVGPEVFSVVAVDPNSKGVLDFVVKGTSDEYTKEKFYSFLKEISDYNPKLVFSFNEDPEGKWIEYRVKRLDFNVGDLVNWENDQGIQFEMPKKIIRIEKFKKTGEEFAIFEGISTGVPLDQLIK